MDYRIISIGSLSQHELWGETASQRTAHATTTLVRSEKQVIVVDPGLPPQVVAARLKDRSGLSPEAVTMVFLTNFRPAHRWGISAFDQADWFISENEREQVGRHLIELFQRAPDDESKRMIEADIQILHRCQNAPDKLAKQVDLFPLPGFTPGNCGLLLLESGTSTLVAGDAVPTGEHLEQGRVLRGAWNVETAKTSLAEAVEIADLIIPGHDNLQLNRTRRGL